MNINRVYVECTFTLYLYIYYIKTVSIELSKPD